MERLELAISGVEKALHLPARASAPGRSDVPAPPPGQGATATLPRTVGTPPWLGAVRNLLPRLVEALGAERTDSEECAFAARGRRLAAERNRLLRQLRALSPRLADGCLSAGAISDHEELRRMLLRLMHDIAHHHQRVNDMVWDASWRDVGGSE